MRKLYLFAVAALSVISGYAQTTIEPPTVYLNDIAATDGDVAAYSFVLNQTGDSTGYIWERNIIEITEGWLTAVCDVVTCHFPTVESSTFGLKADSLGTLDVHVYTNFVDPNGVDGAAIVEVTVTNLSDEDDVAVGTYYFNQALSTPERITNALKIYPNPVVSEFFIEGADDVQRVEIYDISGRLVKEVQSFGQGSINVDDLGNGNYIVRMWNDSNKQLSSNVLTIQ